MDDSNTAGSYPEMMDTDMSRARDYLSNHMLMEGSKVGDAETMQEYNRARSNIGRLGNG